MHATDAVLPQEQLLTTVFLVGDPVLFAPLLPLPVDGGCRKESPLRLPVNVGGFHRGKGKGNREQGG